MVIPFFIWKCKSTSVYDALPMGDLRTPSDNLQSEAKIELGRKLFFDKRLSIDNTVSCATCHLPEFAFTDRKITS